MKAKKAKAKPSDHKVALSIRLDSEMIECAKDEAQKLGIGYQTRINQILREYYTGQGQTILSRIVALEKKVKR